MEDSSISVISEQRSESEKQGKEVIALDESKREKLEEVVRNVFLDSLSTNQELHQL